MNQIAMKEVATPIDYIPEEELRDKSGDVQPLGRTIIRAAQQTSGAVDVIVMEALSPGARSLTEAQYVALVDELDGPARQVAAAMGNSWEQDWLLVDDGNEEAPSVPRPEK
jgi:hypothetical protein